MARAGVSQQDIAGVEELFAVGTVDGPRAGLAADVAAELAWWRALPDRRPMAFAPVEADV
jgi:hypothetical protein